MTKSAARGAVRCAVYTRKSSEEGLDQAFNSLDAQREACEAYIASQRHEGWTLLPTLYDDGGFSGGTLKRPALQRLLDDIQAGEVDLVVVYKIDRLTRSLMDFAKLVEVFDQHETSFVSVTQHFNTTSSMGRLTLNVLLSFAQFEREVTGERIRDKVAASRRKGLWMGGPIPLGYRVVDKRLEVNELEAPLVRRIFEDYARIGSVEQIKQALDRDGVTGRARAHRGEAVYATSLSRGAIYAILQRYLYIGDVRQANESYAGKHEAIIPRELWDAVQARLTGSRRDRVVGTTASTSLLAGIIFDSRGHRLAPSHTGKGGKRYRYYLTRPAETGAKRMCLPAHDVERIATEQWLELLGAADLDERLAITDVTEANAVRARARLVAGKWTALSVAARREWLFRAGVRVTVSHRRVETAVDPSALAEALGERPKANAGRHSQPLRFAVDAALTKVAGETRVLEQKDTHVAAALMPSHVTLLRAVAQGRDWARRLASGEFADADDIAAVTGLSQAHVARGLKCMLLPAALIEQLAAGRAPASLTWVNIRANRETCGA